MNNCDKNCDFLYSPIIFANKKRQRWVPTAHRHRRGKVDPDSTSCGLCGIIMRLNRPVEVLGIRHAF